LEKRNHGSWVLQGQRRNLFRLGDEMANNMKVYENFVVVTRNKKLRWFGHCIRNHHDPKVLQKNYESKCISLRTK